MAFDSGTWCLIISDQSKLLGRLLTFDVVPFSVVVVVFVVVFDDDDDDDDDGVFFYFVFYCHAFPWA